MEISLKSLKIIFKVLLYLTEILLFGGAFIATTVRFCTVNITFYFSIYIIYLYEERSR